MLCSFGPSGFSDSPVVAITTWRVENDSACLGALALSIATSNESSMWDIWCCYNTTDAFCFSKHKNHLEWQTHGYVDLGNSLGEFSIISVHIRYLIIVLANQIKLTFYYVSVSCVDIISRIRYIKHPYLNEENTSVAASLRFCSWCASLSLQSFRARRWSFDIWSENRVSVRFQWNEWCIYNIYTYIYIYIYTVYVQMHELFLLICWSFSPLFWVFGEECVNWPSDLFVV